MGLRLAIDESERLFLQVILIQDMIWMVWRRWTYMSKMRNNAKATCAFKLELSDLVARWLNKKLSTMSLDGGGT